MNTDSCYYDLYFHFYLFCASYLKISYVDHAFLYYQDYIRKFHHSIYPKLFNTVSLQFIHVESGHVRRCCHLGLFHKRSQNLITQFINKIPTSLSYNTKKSQNFAHLPTVILWCMCKFWRISETNISNKSSIFIKSRFRQTFLWNKPWSIDARIPGITHHKNRCDQWIPIR